jgi:hypothetical protein
VSDPRPIAIALEVLGPQEGLYIGQLAHFFGLKKGHVTDAKPT